MAILSVRVLLTKTTTTMIVYSKIENEKEESVNVASDLNLRWTIHAPNDNASISTETLETSTTIENLVYEPSQDIIHFEKENVIKHYQSYSHPSVFSFVYVQVGANACTGCSAHTRTDAQTFTFTIVCGSSSYLNKLHIHK